MPRGVYPRKKKADSPAKAARTTKGADKSFAKLLATMRAERTKYEDRVVALGTAIEALEALDA
jgi:hypothetical protein